LASECDATLVIAPEFHGVLADRSAAVERLGRRLLGPSSAVVQLCGDKLELARRLRERGIASIPTEMLPDRPDCASLPYPVVIKPRHGAGAVNTFLAHSSDELAGIHRQAFDPPHLPPDVWQPFVPGRALSVSATLSDGQLNVFPVGEQRVIVAPLLGS